MDDSTLCFMVLTVCVGGFLWFRWYYPFWTDQLHTIRPNRALWLMQLVPVISAILMWYVITQFGASDVRNDMIYILEYFLLGLAWIGLTDWLGRFLGVHVVYDVIERGNVSALFVVGGALLGMTFCYLGGNIGEGPGPEVVIFSAGLATLIFFAIWWVYILITKIDLMVTIDRNVAAGLRLGGFLLAAGLILGRAAAGNWVSVEATISDMFRFGSPIVILLIGAILIDFVTRPTVDRPSPPLFWFGLVPSFLFVGAAVAYLMIGQFPA